MEDIAKIYDALGHFEISAAWLKQALIAAWSIWPAGWIGVDHIIEKLESSLKRRGLTEEAVFWKICSPAYE